MAEKGYIPDHLKDAVFLAKKAGSFSDVPLRTLQSWTEKGLVIPGIEDTTGTGSKRLYSVLNCIEIAIIKEFTKERMRLDIVKRLMDFLREPYTYKKVDGKLIPATKVTVLEKLLINKPGFLVYEFGEGDVPSLSFVTYEDLHEVARKRFGKPFSAKEKHIRDSVIEHLPYLALPMNYFKKVILNITVIAAECLIKWAKIFLSKIMQCAALCTFMEVKMKINWPLRTKIVEKYRTNVDFAQSLGVSETLVSKIIRGRRKLDLEKQIIWAKALECKPKEIFPDEGQNSG